MDHDHNNEHEDPTELDILFSALDEKNARLDKQMREQIETRRSVARTMQEEEEARLRDLNRVGSYDASLAMQRENIRKSELERDAERRKRRAQADLDTLY